VTAPSFVAAAASTPFAAEKTVVIFGAVKPSFIQFGQKFAAFDCHSCEHAKGDFEAPNLAFFVKFESGLDSGGSNHGRTRLEKSVKKEPVAHVAAKHAHSDAAIGYKRMKVRHGLVLVIKLFGCRHQ
jgi:hypothetical protein